MHNYGHYVFLQLNCAVLFIACKIVSKRFDQHVVKIHKTYFVLFSLFDTRRPTVISLSRCLQFTAL